MMKSIERFKPAVRRHWLVFAAGVEWSAVGVGLMAVACYWLYPSTWPLRIALVALSVALGVAMHFLALFPPGKKEPQKDRLQTGDGLPFRLSGQTGLFSHPFYDGDGLCDKAFLHTERVCRGGLFYDGTGPYPWKFLVLSAVFKRLRRLIAIGKENDAWP